MSASISDGEVSIRSSFLGMASAQDTPPTRRLDQFASTLTAGSPTFVIVNSTGSACRLRSMVRRARRFAFTLEQLSTRALCDNAAELAVAPEPAQHSN
jgi:hypothetical protein